MLESAIELLYTKETAARFLELNDLTMLSLMANMDVALVDMPELLLRMKIANDHSLEELQDIFNVIVNKMKRFDTPCLTTGQAAVFHFPEVFAQPRDEYVAAMIKEIAMHTGAHN